MEAAIKRSFLDFEGRQIHYRIAGEGDPILLLHMTPRSSDEFRELMPFLAQNRCAIAMDLMGLGDSDPPPHIYSVADYAKTAIALWDELGIQKSSILGNLTGSYIAGEIAAAYSERVEKLILCNVFGFDKEGKEQILKRYSEGFSIEDDGSHLLKRWLARINYVGTGQLNHRCVIDDLKCFGSPVYTGLAVANYCLTVKERFQSIQCPTLILSGEKALEPLENSGLTSSDSQLCLPEIIPQSQSLELLGGTLWMMNQRPEEVSQIIINFLECH